MNSSIYKELIKLLNYNNYLKIKQMNSIIMVKIKVLQKMIKFYIRKGLVYENYLIKVKIVCNKQQLWKIMIKTLVLKVIILFKLLNNLAQIKTFIQVK